MIIIMLKCCYFKHLYSNNSSSTDRKDTISTDKYVPTSTDNTTTTCTNNNVNTSSDNNNTTCTENKFTISTDNNFTTSTDDTIDINIMLLPELMMILLHNFTILALMITIIILILI